MSSRGIACLIVSYLSWATAVLSPSLGRELLDNFNLTFFKEGLPQNSVKAICQTSDGYLWFGTRFGLVRFDGINEHVFDPGTDPPLEDDRATFGHACFATGVFFIVFRPFKRHVLFYEVLGV